METFWRVLVWGSLLVLFYTYLGYPLVVYMLVRLRNALSRREAAAAEIAAGDAKPSWVWPTVSILIPAYNEERVIRRKVENTLELDYPREKLQIVVVSDGSTDRTNEMLASYSDGEIEVIRFSRRQGKTAVLNAVIPRLRGEIAILSDASGLITRDSLKRLIAPFADPQVGGVCGSYRFDADDESLRGITEKFYWRYETFLKEYESRLHSSIGAHGAFYGFRRHLFEPLNEKAINDDFILPMQLVRKGYRVLYEPRATVLEHESTTLVGEFNRRIRINVGNFQQIFILHSLLDVRRGIIAFEFISHKVLRAFGPFLVLLLPIACYFAASPIYLLLLQLQLAFYLFALFGYFQEFLGIRVRYLYLPFYFLAGNISAVIGFFKFIFKKQSMLWERV